MDIILASTSKPRALLLQQICKTFKTVGPDIDETPQPGETADQLVLRLAQEKALAVSQQYPNALVIGADQVAVQNNVIQGKPGNHRTAVEWLKKVSGQKVCFTSGMSLARNQKILHTSNTQTIVTYRKLTPKQIEFYVAQEKPFHAAGAMHIEGLGICLATQVESCDPSAMLGLSLTKLTVALAEAGYDLLQ